MSSFASASFSTSSFSTLAFDFDGVAPPTPTPEAPPGYGSGAYFLRMSEAEFNKRRHRLFDDLGNAESRIKLLGEIPELHAAIIAPAGETFKQKRSREMRLSNIIAKRILRDHEAEVRRAAAAQEDEDEEMLINFILH